MNNITRRLRYSVSVGSCKCTIILPSLSPTFFPLENQFTMGRLKYSRRGSSSNKIKDQLPFCLLIYASNFPVAANMRPTCRIVKCLIDNQNRIDDNRYELFEIRKGN